MFSSLRLTGTVAVVVFFIQYITATCLSYGVDFHDGETHFQNSLSSDPFTFVSQFSGCHPDEAFNLLIDPQGETYICSNTSLTPDDTNMLSSCPITKNNMFSGNWEITILSDNDGEPIAYQRAFELIVGPQQTFTYTPTVTVPSTSTLISTMYSTATITSFTTLQPVTTTVPSTTISPTTVVTPRPATTALTRTLFKLVLTKWSVDVRKTIVTRTAQCHIPKRQAMPDPTATVIPQGFNIAGMDSSTDGKKRRSPMRRVKVDRDLARAPKNRRDHLAQLNGQKVQKRAPDQETVTVTDPNTSNYVTTTVITTTSSTVTATTTSTVTATITPPPVVIVNGQTTAATRTITASQSTRTFTKFTIATSWTTKTYAPTVTITVKTTPPAVSSACRSAGGVIW